VTFCGRSIAYCGEAVGGRDTLERGFAGVDVELVAKKPGPGLAGWHVNRGHGMRAMAASVHLEVGGAIVGHRGRPPSGLDSSILAIRLQ
jgi:hypothetical protein